MTLPHNIQICEAAYTLRRATATYRRKCINIHSVSKKTRQRKSAKQKRASGKNTSITHKHTCSGPEFAPFDCRKASSAPPKSLSGSAVWAFPRGDTVFSAPDESAEEPFRALSPGRVGMFMPFSYVHRHPSVSVLRKSVVKIFYFLFA